jgi:hypothetical protein
MEVMRSSQTLVYGVTTHKFYCPKNLKYRLFYNKALLSLLLCSVIYLNYHFRFTHGIYKLKRIRWNIFHCREQIKFTEVKTLVICTDAVACTFSLFYNDKRDVWNFKRSISELNSQNYQFDLFSKHSFISVCFNPRPADLSFLARQSHFYTGSK